MSGSIAYTMRKRIQDTLPVTYLLLPNIYRLTRNCLFTPVMKVMHTSSIPDQASLPQNFDMEELAGQVQTNMSVVPSTERLTRIKTILKAFHDLPPHEVRKHQTSESEDMENEQSDIDGTAHDTQDLFDELNTSEVKSYQFSRNLNHIQQSLSKHPQLTAGENEALCTLNSIFLLHSDLGFGLKVISRLMNINPEVFQFGETVLKNKIANLRKHRLNEGFLQRAVSHTPQYLTLPEAKINDTVNFLVGDLDFATKELPELFLYSPQIFFDSLKSTEDKFQYIYFAMGYKKHYVLARHGVMRYSLRHIRTRHLFLERRGQFQMTDKNRSTTIVNPQLKKILCSSDAYFCREVARCKQDELSLFHRVLAIEDNLRDSDAEDSANTMELADQLLQEMKL